MTAESDDKQIGSGPRYPFIPLRKAIERARKLWDAAGDNGALYADAVALWGYKATSSGGNQSVAALKYYKLVYTLASKDTRKLRLTDEARRYFLDERPEKHGELHRYFALQPKAMELLWQLWRDKPPAEPIARSTLKVDYNYSENAARELLAIYSDNLSYAGLNGSGKMSPEASSDVEPAFGRGTDDEASRSLTVIPQPLADQTGPRSPVSHYITQGTREDTFNLPEGMVTLSFPENFSEASYEDLRAWLEFQQSRLKRWVRSGNG